MIIRKAVLRDCIEIYNLCKTKEFSEDGKPPKKWWIESFIKEKQIIFVAEDNNEIVGFVFGEKISGNVGLLQMIFVKKTLRRKGWGKGLLKSFEKECKLKRLKVIMSYGNIKSPIIKLFLKRRYKKSSNNLYIEYHKWL